MKETSYFAADGSTLPATSWQPNANVYPGTGTVSTFNASSLTGR